MIARMRLALLRFRTVFLGDLIYHARRPLFAVWALVLVLTAWGLSSGSVRIVSGDAAVGGTKAHITSEFAIAMQLGIFTTLFYAFFISVAAGMTIIQDEEWRLGDLLHATRTSPRRVHLGQVRRRAGRLPDHPEYSPGGDRFLLPHDTQCEAQEFRGPFHLLNYLKPALVFSVPTIVFLAGVSFAMGEWTRRAVLVFLLPVAIVILDGFFLWEWSPSWLDPRIDYALMLIDSAGFRWLNETWLKVDRGVNFYNNAAIPLDAGFPDQPGGFHWPGFAGRGVSAAAISPPGCAAPSHDGPDAALSAVRARSTAGRHQAGHPTGITRYDGRSARACLQAPGTSPESSSSSCARARGFICSFP